MQKRYTAAVFTVKTPMYFCLMRICEGNFRTEEQKNGSPESFWMRLSEEGERNQNSLSSSSESVL